MANNKTLLAAIERKDRQIVKLKHRKRFTKTRQGWGTATDKIKAIELQILNIKQQIIFNGVSNGHRANKRE